MKLTVKMWRDGRGLYRAAVGQLPGCVAVAATEDEVRQRIRSAVTGYIASLHATRPVNLEHELVEQTV